MKIRLFSLFLITFGLVLFLGGCKSTMKSSKTGWAYNEIKNGGYEYKPGFNQPTGPGLVFVEGGTFTLGRVTDDVRYDWNNIPRRVTVASFYMDETEVTNADYREYLHWLKRVYTDYPLIYQQALPDTLVWRGALAFNEPMTEYYLRHPSYNDYPVVGVTWIQATQYCDWRTDRVNESNLIREGILMEDPNQTSAKNFNTDAYLAGQYEGVVRQDLPNLDPNQTVRKVRMEDGLFHPKYRLPTEAEWEFAALGLVGKEENIPDKRMFPWRGNYTRNEEKAKRGDLMANFVRGRGDYMGVSGTLNDGYPYTSPVKTYLPNDYGLYDMAGNVNEWVLDVYRPLSSVVVDDLSPYRGNVFTVQQRDAEGNIAEKDSLGKIPRRTMTAEENKKRVNYKKSDNRNFRDGDGRSSIGYISSEEDDSKSTAKMYFQGTGADKIGLTSTITDRARVFKGGSWRDRAYWMVPGTRRYMDDDKSSDDIGFRCAMSRLGRADGK